MANTISTRSAIFVQFNVDLNAAGGVALRLICNRDYAVVDYNVLVVAAGAGSATNASITATDISAVPVTTTIGLVTGILAGNYQRATQNNNAAATGFLAAASTVVRGGTLTVNAPDIGDFVSGYLTVLPGNRYGATTSNTSYYANNSASGNNNGTVAI
jgi:hypothetical protein